MNCYEPRIYAENLPETADYTEYRQITLNNPYAEFEVTEKNIPVTKENLKILSDDEHTYIYLPSGNYKINFSGNTDEFLELSAKDQKGFEKNYRNISLTANKTIEFDVEDYEMFVTDGNGKNIMRILTDGTEEKIKKPADSALITGTAAGTVLIIGISALLVKRRKKGE